MPIYHCTECDHEWEGCKNHAKCDWCGADGYVLEEKAPIEKLFTQGLKNYLKLLRDMKKEEQKK